MKRTILLLTLLATIFVSASGVAWAISGSGAVNDTNNKYNKVGVLYDDYYGFYCSGTLIQVADFAAWRAASRFCL